VSTPPNCGDRITTPAMSRSICTVMWSTSYRSAGRAGDQPCGVGAACLHRRLAVRPSRRGSTPRRFST